MSKKLSTEERQSRILQAAYLVAVNEGFGNVTRDKVATKARCSTGTVSKYYTMDNLLRCIMRLAEKNKNMQILQHNLLRQYIPLTPQMKQKVLKSIKN